MRQVQHPPARTTKPTASVEPAHRAAMLLDSSLATRSDQTRPSPPYLARREAPRRPSAPEPSGDAGAPGTGSTVPACRDTTICLQRPDGGGCTMSIGQNPVQNPTKEEPQLRDAVHAWFVEHGVPQFTNRYSPTDQLRFLVLPLAVLVAFLIGAAPQLPSTLLPLLVVPPVVLALMGCARPFLWKLLGRRGPACQHTRRRLAGLLLMLVALSALLLRSGWPRPWSDAWVDFAVIIVAEFASMAVFTRDVWSGNAGRLAGLHLRLVAYTVGAVILFAFLLTLDQAAVINSQQLLDALVPGHEIPLAVPALVCMTIILRLALAIADRASPTAGPSEGNASFLVAICFPAVPLLVLVFAAQTTVLREADWLGWARVWLPLAALLVLFVLSAVWWGLSSAAWWQRLSSAAPRWPHRPEGRAGTPTDGRAAWDRISTWDRISKGAGHPLFFIPLLAASLIGYPIQVPSDLGFEAFGWSVWGGAAAAVTFGAYAFLVWFCIWFGLDQIAVWVSQEIRRHLMQIVRGVTGGLPMLLVFATFSALTAETWQVIVEIEGKAFIALVGLLVALTLGVLVILAKQQLSRAQGELEPQTHLDDEVQPDEAKRREAWEQDWQKVRQRAQRNGQSGQEGMRDAVSALFDAMPAERKDLSPKLELRMRINALLVIGVYQALVLVPVAIGALVLFWLVGRLTVSPEVAAQWVYGDNALTDPNIKGLDKIEGLSLFGEPWTRVPVVLAAFSVLYLTVQLLTNEKQQEYFFSAASAALQQRLAVRIAYRVVFRDPVAAPEHLLGRLVRTWRARRPWRGRLERGTELAQDASPSL
jgi:hypothetical protein